MRQKRLDFLTEYLCIIYNFAALASDRTVARVTYYKKQHIQT